MKKVKLIKAKLGVNPEDVGKIFNAVPHPDLDNQFHITINPDEEGYDCHNHLHSWIVTEDMIEDIITSVDSEVESPIGATNMRFDESPKIPVELNIKDLPKPGVGVCNLVSSTPTPRTVNSTPKPLMNTVTKWIIATSLTIALLVAASFIWDFKSLVSVDIINNGESYICTYEDNHIIHTRYTCTGSLPVLGF